MNIKGDITGGLTAGVVALPLCLAFGIASGLGAAAGLYGAIVLSFFAAVFGGTKTQISGPTGPMTVVTASVVVAVGGNMALICCVFVVAGLFQILFGFLHLGRLIRYIPYSVTSGFMNGVGLIIILLQLAPMLGGDSPKGPVDGIMCLGSIDINYTSLALGVAALAIIFLTPKKISSFIPAPLLALIVLSLVSFYSGADVRTIGEVPSGLPDLHIPHFSMDHMITILGYGITLALLGCIDSLLTSLIADSITKTKHNPNRELIGQGLGNALCGIFGGLVGAGATMRTVTNIKLGGNSRLSGVISSLFLVSVLLAFHDLVAFVPVAVLSGILIKVGIDIFDYRLLKEIKVMPKPDFALMTLVFLLTVFVNLIFAVAVGVVVAVLVHFWQARKMHFEERNTTISFEKKGDVTVASVKGPLYFGTSAKIALGFAKEEAKRIILDIRSISLLDVSGIYALEDEIEVKRSRGTQVLLVANADQPLMNMRTLLGEDSVFEDVESSLK